MTLTFTDLVSARVRQALDGVREPSDLQAVLAVVTAAGVGPVLPIVLAVRAVELLGHPMSMTDLRDHLVRLGTLVSRGRPGQPHERVGIAHAAINAALLHGAAELNLDVRAAHRALADAITVLLGHGEQEGDLSGEAGPVLSAEAYNSAAADLAAMRDVRAYALAAGQRHYVEAGDVTSADQFAERLDAGGAAREAEALQQLLEHQVRTLGPVHPDTLATRASLGSLRGEAGDAEGAVSILEEVLADMVRVLGPNHPGTLTTRGNLAYWRGRAGDAAGAVAAYRELLTHQLQVLGPDYPTVLTTQANLARWQGDAGDPAGAAAMFQVLLNNQLRVLGPDHPDTLTIRRNLAYWRGQAGDAAGAAAAYQELLGAQLRVLSANKPDVTTTRTSLAYWREKAESADRVRTEHPDLLAEARSERIGPFADADAAVQAARAVIEATPRDHPGRATMLSNLGTALRFRFERTGSFADLDEAVHAARAAVEVTPPGHPNRAAYLANLGSALRLQFGSSGWSPYLDEAVLTARDAVAATPPGHPDRAVYLANLAAALRLRYEHTGSLADLDEAVLSARDAVGATRPGHPGRAAMLSNLGTALRFRFEGTGSLADLDEAVSTARAAVEATPPGHPDRAVYLANLATALRLRSERTGAQEDLDEAVTVSRDAVAATPSGHPDRAVYLANLAAALRLRFEHTGSLADLDEAVLTARDAVATTPPDHPKRAVYLANLGSALRLQFGSTGSSAYLDEAVSTARAAVEATPPGHPDRAVYLTNLAAAVGLRFERIGSLADVDETVLTARAAVEATPPGHPDRAVYLTNLAAALRLRFEHTESLADVDEAVRATGMAVEIIPRDHPDRSRCLSEAGVALAARFRSQQHQSDADQAIRYLQLAASQETAATAIRVEAGRAWGSLAFATGRLDSALDGYSTAVGLLPVAAWHGSDQTGRDRYLASWTELVADAAAVAIRVGDPRLAVELLEQGRVILWTQMLKLRSEVAYLAQQVPGLATRFEQFRQILDTPIPSGHVGRIVGQQITEPDYARVNGSWHESVERRRRLAREWDSLLEQVRRLPGFEDFLSSVPFARLRAAAVDGPVVILNVSTYGCDALILEAERSDVWVVSLTSLTYEEAVDRAGTMAEVMGDPQLFPESAHRNVNDILAWLWDAVAEPVLTALGHSQPVTSGQDWPRVWWYRTGAMTLLPIHAAGHYSRDANGAGRGKSVPDRVVSSYIPSLASLGRTRRPNDTSAVEQLVVGMPTTPGLPPLPGVIDEMQALVRHLPKPDYTRLLVGPQATRSEVLVALTSYPWVHLSCHSSNDWVDPYRSGLNLWDGLLTVRDIALTDVSGIQLAYLSASSTAIGSLRPFNEFIHLADALQLLGCRHVIATLWPVSDKRAAKIAETVYNILTNSGQPDAARAAQALHDASGLLRAEFPTEPLLWAPYIHLGP